MTAFRNDQHQSKKNLHRRGHPHMTVPLVMIAGVADQNANFPWFSDHFIKGSGGIMFSA